MAAFPRTLTLILTLAVAAPAMAQTTTAPAPTDQAQTGTAGTDATTAAPAADPATPAAAPDGIGQPYVAETFGDWSLRCIRTTDGADPCQLYQLLKDKTGTPMAEVTVVALPKGGKIAAGATIITPLETLLIDQLSFAIDGGKPATYPFSFCTQVGCIARLGFTAEEVARLRQGKVATVTVVPVADPNATVSAEVSLSGFTKALEAQAKTEAANATKAAPAAAPAEAAPADAAPQQ